MNAARRWTFLAISTLLLCGFPGVSSAQESGVGRVNSFLDALNRSLTYLGEKSESLFAPKLAPMDEYRVDPFSGLTKVSRNVNNAYPARKDVAVSVTNEFGSIRVQAWDNPVVKVEAVITVGAGDPETAGRILAGVEAAAVEAAGTLDVRSRIPDVRALGTVVVEVNYVLTVPRGASLNCSNTFGDTSLQGLSGAVALDARYGVVDLRDLAGPVTVRAQGEFPLTAQGLRQGGGFVLRGTQAEFTGVSGALKVSNFHGSLTLRGLPPECAVDLQNESGPIHVYLEPASAPDLSASALFGDVSIDSSGDKVTRGHVVSVQRREEKAKQRLQLHTSFDTVYIHREAAASDAAAAPVPERKTFDRSFDPAPLTIAEGLPIRITATRGQVRVTGADTDRVTVRARAVVEVASSDAAKAALEALDCALERNEEAAVIETSAQGDFAALGCSSFRVDVTVECPRTSPVIVKTQNGDALVTDLGAGATLEAGKGTLIARHVKGTLHVTGAEGSVDISECEGPVKIALTKGDIKTRAIYSRQEIEAGQGKTFVDAPLGEVSARQQSGEVRIVAADGIRGNCDVTLEKGNLRLLAAPSSDAAFTLLAENGEIYAKDLVLTGSIRGGVRQFMGQLNAGTSKVSLTTKNGDIFID